MYEDKTLVCKECGKEFVFTAGEQEFYAERGFQNEPQRCKACRDARKNATRGPREYFTATCAACGGEAEPPPLSGGAFGQSGGAQIQNEPKGARQSGCLSVFLCWGIQRSRRSCGSGCAKSVLGKPMGDAPSARSARAASLPSSKTKSGRLMLCR